MEGGAKEVEEEEAVEEGEKEEVEERDGTVLEFRSLVEW